jgi:uncharacterized membrane protein YkgB
VVITKGRSSIANEELPMRYLMASVLELLGLVLVAVALGVLISPWAAVAVAGAGVLVAGVIMDRQAVEE